jgi:SAM-dependent methyltransferase
VTRIDDPSAVREQYASETNLAARKSIYADVTGPDARDLIFQAVAEAQPGAVLEVGCGEGELAERMTAALSAEVVAIDQSERMVELARARGVDARVGDVQELPFADGSFDVVVAAWMLYHVPDLDRGIGELARVLRPGGRLVAATNASDHLREMLELAGVDDWDFSFRAENGAELLGRYFPAVETRDAYGTVTLHSADHLESSIRLHRWAEGVPELAEPLMVRRRPVVFVATKL